MQLDSDVYGIPALEYPKHVKVQDVGDDRTTLERNGFVLYSKEILVLNFGQIVVVKFELYELYSTFALNCMNFNWNKIKFLKFRNVENVALRELMKKLIDLRLIGVRARGGGARMRLPISPS